ncbi:hypothetical protein BHM03_00043432 [Ensete ventricosum]|nr:hypothetical protein BHM03_00043432 [Ensete ventricosum]
MGVRAPYPGKVDKGGGGGEGGSSTRLRWKREGFLCVQLPVGTKHQRTVMLCVHTNTRIRKSTILEVFTRGRRRTHKPLFRRLLSI